MDPAHHQQRLNQAIHLHMVVVLEIQVCFVPNDYMLLLRRDSLTSQVDDMHLAKL